MLIGDYSSVGGEKKTARAFIVAPETHRVTGEWFDDDRWWCKIKLILFWFFYFYSILSWRKMSEQLKQDACDDGHAKRMLIKMQASITVNSRDNLFCAASALSSCCEQKFIL